MVAHDEPRGLEAVVAAETRLAAIDGTAGTLAIAGFSIDDLAQHATFEEMLHLTLYGELPTAGQLDDLRAAIQAAQSDEEAIHLINSLPFDGEPIDALRTAVSALGQHDALADGTSADNVRRIGLRLAALMPVALAAIERRARGAAPIPPHSDLGHAATFLYMLRGRPASDLAARSFDTYLVLLAEHGLNASTFAARVAISAGSDTYAAITAAIATLKGNAHGGANRRAMEMLLSIGSPQRVEAYVEESLAQRRRLMGLGHRIYKTRDPRARHLEQLARALAAESGDAQAFETAQRIEQLAATHPYFLDRKLYPNVEFFSAPVLYGVGLRPEAMPAAFALSRIAGWTGHIIEQLADNRLIRPQSRYIGASPRPFVAIENRVDSRQ